MTSSNQYWASLPADEFVNHLHKKIDSFYEDLQNTKIFYVLERAFVAYYGGDLANSNFAGQIFDGAELQRSGDKNQIYKLKVNHLRNLIQHTLQLVVSERPAWDCRATNTDYKSQAQCILGRGLLDYYYTEKNFQKYYKQAVENALVLFEGWIHAPWNENIGEPVGVDEASGIQLHEGDFEFSCHTMLDVIRDISIRNDEPHEWLILKSYGNKFNLAAKYSAFADDILSESNTLSTKHSEFESFELRLRHMNAQKDSDRIPIFTFYHRPTEAMPKGRMSVFVNKRLLFDGPLPYKKIPLYQVFPESIIGSPYGYSVIADLLGPQQALDILSSTIMTNNAANGIQNIWTKKNDDLSVNELGGGMKHLSSMEEPKALQLTKSAPETFNFRKDIIGEMETLIGISATVRGNPEASLKSGAALALVVSQSIQFASILEQSVNSMLEEFGTDLLNNLKVFAKSQRIVALMGEASRPYQKEFSGEDLANISRVTVQRASPISKTTAGRLQIADTLLEKGFVEDAKEYITVLTTGQLEPMTSGIQTELLNIRAECEALRNGEEVTVILTENHAEHIKIKKRLIENPEAKKNPEFVARVLKNIQDHLDAWRALPPELALITGQQPLPPQMSAASPAPVVSSDNAGPVTPDQMPNNPNMPSLPANSPAEAQQSYDKLLTQQ